MKIMKITLAVLATTMLTLGAGSAMADEHHPPVHHHYHHHRHHHPVPVHHDVGPDHR